MSTSDIIVGLDIGTTKIAAIVGRKNEYNKIEILGIGKSESIGVTRGVVTNIEKTVASIRAAIEEAENNSGVDIKVVNVGIAGMHIRSLQQRGNRMRNSLDTEIHQDDIDALIEDMYKLVMNPGEEIIHVIPQEYVIDNEPGVKDPIGMAGICLEGSFHIVIGQVTAAQNIYKCVQKAGLEVSELILEPIASAEAVLSEEEKEAGVALVDIGGGTTDIAIFQDGIIRHTAVIPFGGNVVTEDIKMGCSIIKSQAEDMKLKFGSALASENRDNEVISVPIRGREPKEVSMKMLANIIQARMEEIIEHVYHEIRASKYENQLISGIVITGGGAMLKHLVQLAEYVTGLDARIGYPNEHLAGGVPEYVSSPLYSTGIGLVVKGFETLEKQNSKQEQPKKKITGHSKEPRGNFFEKIFSKGKRFFDDDDVK
ncbi:MAG: cell division protein FtsA [Bacteroidota bacterium]